jgi:hypothetical protein
MRILGAIGFLGLLCVAQVTHAALIFSERFSEGFFPPTGWVIQNNSNPTGTKTWGLGAQDTTLTSAAGDQNFASVNYESAGNQSASVPSATASNWLITPAITFQNGDVVAFSTSAFKNQDNPDRLQLRLNAANTGTNVGNSATSVGDFTALLLDIDPDYSTGNQPSGYPITWTSYAETITGLSGPTPGRLGFRYYVENSGPDGTNGNEIGIDDVSVSAPEPCPLGILGSALLLRRRRDGSCKALTGLKK